MVMRRNARPKESGQREFPEAVVAEMDGSRTSGLHAPSLVHPQLDHAAVLRDAVLDSRLPPSPSMSRLPALGTTEINEERKSESCGTVS
jgi:hypothetical protein